MKNWIENHQGILGIVFLTALLVASCPMPLTEGLVAVAEDHYQPKIAITSHERYATYFSELEIQGTVHDDAIAPADGAGTIRRLSFVVASGSEYRGGILIDSTGAVTQDPEMGSNHSLEFDSRTGAYHFVVNTAELRGSIEVTISATDARGNSSSVNLPLRGSMGPFVQIHQPNNENRYFSKKSEKTLEGSIGNSSQFKERIDEIKTIEFYFGSQSGIMDLSSVNFESILENETIETTVDFYEYTISLNLSNGIFLCENFLPPDSWGTNDMILRVIATDKNGLSTEESFTMFYSNGMPLIEMKEPKNETHFFSSYAQNQVQLRTFVEESVKSISKIEYKVVDKNDEETVFIQKEIIKDSAGLLPNPILDTLDFSEIKTDCKLMFRVIDESGGVNELYRIFNFDGDAPVVHDVGFKKHGESEFLDVPIYLKKNDIFEICFKVSDAQGGAGLAEEENSVYVGIQNNESTKQECQKNDDGYYYAQFLLDQEQDSYQIPLQFYLTDKLKNSTNGNTPGNWDSKIRYYSKALTRNEVIENLTLDGSVRKTNSILTAIGTFENQLQIDIDCERDLDLEQCYVDFNSGNDVDKQYFDSSIGNIPDGAPQNITFNKLSPALSGDSLELNIYLTDMAGNSYEYKHINENITEIILDDSPPMIGTPELSLSENKWLYKDGYLIFGNVDKFIVNAPISDVSSVSSALAIIVVDEKEMIEVEGIENGGDYSFEFPREQLLQIEDNHAFTVRINAFDHFSINSELPSTHAISTEYSLFEKEQINSNINGFSSSAQIKLDYQEPELFNPSLKYIGKTIEVQPGAIEDTSHVAMVQYEFLRGEEIISPIVENYDDGTIPKFEHDLINNSDVLQGSLTCFVTASDYFGNESIRTECNENVIADFESLSIESVEWGDIETPCHTGTVINSIITFNEELRSSPSIFYVFIHESGAKRAVLVDSVTENLESETINDWIASLTIPQWDFTNESEQIIANKISLNAAGKDKYGNHSSDVSTSQFLECNIENVLPVITDISTKLLSDSREVEFSVTVEDSGAGLDISDQPNVNVQLWFNDETSPYEIKELLDVGDSNTVTFKVPYNNLLEKELSPLHIWSRATDEFGNQSVQYGAERILNINAPELVGTVQWSVDDVAGSSKAKAGSQLKLEFSLSKEIEGTPNVQLILNHYSHEIIKDLTSAVEESATENTWIANFDIPTATDDDQLLYGLDNQVKIQAKDPQGNTLSYSQNLTGLKIDNFPPQVIVTSSSPKVEFSSDEMILKVWIVDRGLLPSHLTITSTNINDFPDGQVSIHSDDGECEKIWKIFDVPMEQEINTLKLDVEDSVGNSTTYSFDYDYSLDFVGNPIMTTEQGDGGELATDIGVLTLEYTLDDDVQNTPLGIIKIDVSDGVYEVPQGEVKTESNGLRRWKTQWSIPRKNILEIDPTKLKFHVIENNDSYFNRSTTEKEMEDLIHNLPTVVSDFESNIVDGITGDDVKFTGNYEDNMFSTCSFSLSLTGTDEVFDVQKNNGAFVGIIPGNKFTLSDEEKAILTIDDGFIIHTRELSVNDSIDQLYLDFAENVTLDEITAVFQSDDSVEVLFSLNEELKNGTSPSIEIELSKSDAFNDYVSFEAIVEQNLDEWKAIWKIPNSEAQTYEYLRLKMSGTDAFNNLRSNITSNVLPVTIMLEPEE